jgi:hypothetical protein
MVYRCLRLLLVICGVTAMTPLPAQPNPEQPTTEQLAVPMPRDGQVLSVTATNGDPKGVVTLTLGEEAAEKVTVRVRSINADNPSFYYQMGNIPDDILPNLTDAALEVAVTGPLAWKNNVTRRYFTRPDLHWYPKGAAFDAAYKRWLTLPPASRHTYTLQVARHGDRCEVWIDGRFLAAFPAGAKATGVITATPGARVQAPTVTPVSETERYLPLNVADSPYRGELRFAQAAAPAIAGLDIPMRMAPADRHVDIGMSRWLRQSIDDGGFYDPYYRRTAWDGVPEQIIFSVPRRYYNYLHLVCAVDNSEDRKPVFGVRVARYRQSWDGSGATQADTTVIVDPRAEQDARVKQAGAIKTADGRSLSLYQVKIPLATGELYDILQQQELDYGDTPDYLYIELTRQMNTRLTNNNGIFEKQATGPRSGVIVFGATLEKSPVELYVRSAATGNVFYQAEKPGYTLEMVNNTAANQAVRLTAQLTDFDGETQTLTRQYTLKPGANTSPLDLSTLPPGWYRADFTLADARQTLWTMPITMAVLPADTRKAGSESPYGTWWFADAHYCEGNADKVLPLVQRMGFRHVSPQGYNEKEGRTGENFAKYGVTLSMINLPKTEEDLRRMLTQFPGTKYGMIFHETGGVAGYFGLRPELLGRQPAPMSDAEKQRRDSLFNTIESLSAIARRVAPDMKIMVGNGGTNFNTHWLSEKLPRKYWDVVGMEMGVQTFSPESQPTGWNLQSMWIANRMKEIYGYGNTDFAVTTCYEVGYRPTADGGLSLRRQADWYTRDALHLLAYQAPNINLGLLMDVNAAYYTSRWGSTGFCYRAPLMMPKPSYVAMATLTRVLDRAKYQRYLPAGSTGLYALEFTAPDGRRYALWAARGTCEVTVELQDPRAAVALVDSMGRERPLAVRNGQATFTVNESPCYLASTSAVTVAQPGTTRHPAPALRQAAVVAPMSDAAQWKVVGEADQTFQGYCDYKPMVPGVVTAANGTPGALALTLAPQPEAPRIVSRYAILEPANGPIPIAGAPNTLGVWVNGNSSWGRVYFQLEDARGRTWTTTGYQEDAKNPGGWDMSDWEDEMSITFDGWRFVSTGLPLLYPSGYYTPDFRNWRCDGDNSVTNTIAYPLKLKRLYVAMRDHLVYLTDMVPATSRTIELKNVTAGIDPNKPLP